MLDLLSFKATDVPAKNELKNAGFEEGGDSWTATGDGGGIDLVDSDASVSGMMFNLIDSRGVNYQYQEIDIPKGHILFLKVVVEVIDNSGLIGVLKADKGTYGRDYYRDVGLFHHKELYTVDEGLRFGAQISADGSASFYDFMVIDLTRTFGKGNEPTVEQMDTLLEQFPHEWFDGTVNLFNGKDTVRQLLELDNDKANKQQEEWITPTLLNGSTGDVKFRKNSLGNVELKGKIVSESVSGFMVLPSDYRPKENAYVILAQTDGSSTRRLIILSSGTVTIQRAETAYLDGVSFPTT